ncbi:MAG TPA: non-homologous end-joining DNA ligase, partial [Kofleriaceae bacterium]|nr:non-homologous end-joining DNA ligase [Kofleriaceae bacterium]
MATRRRRTAQRDDAFGLARQIVLAPITHAEAGAPDRAGDLVEPAWDGHRVLATRVGDDVRLAALDFREWTKTFPGIARALGKLAPARLALDGVVCVLEGGVPSFDALRAAVGKGVVASAVLIAWDLLWDGDDDLRARPLAERRARLAKLLAGAPAALMPSQALAEPASRVVAAARGLGLRGVVVRALDGDHAAPWRARSCTRAPIEWQRSLSPPPPLSNADKVLYPRDAITKHAIAAYYRAIAPTMVPYLIDRPVVVQRWPDGIDDFHWYQHRVPPRAPDYLRAAWVDGVRRIVIENGDALLWMVNQAGLTYHVFGARLASALEPDWAMIDLDPGDRATWFDDLVAVALAVRRTLELLELPSVVKTSGQRGLHVYVPLARGHTFEQAEALARGIAVALARLMPDTVTLENDKAKRAGRLLVDHKQFPAKTLVAPYSLRAADGATVATPIAWDE